MKIKFNTEQVTQNAQFSGLGKNLQLRGPNLRVKSFASVNKNLEPPGPKTDWSMFEFEPAAHTHIHYEVQTVSGNMCPGGFAMKHRDSEGEVARMRPCRHQHFSASSARVTNECKNGVLPPGGQSSTARSRGHAARVNLARRSRSLSQRRRVSGLAARWGVWPPSGQSGAELPNGAAPFAPAFTTLSLPSTGAGNFKFWCPDAWLGVAERLDLGSPHRTSHIQPGGPVSGRGNTRA